VDLAGQGSAPTQEPKPPELLKEELSLLAIRLEASRDQLEALIADTRRVRKGWEEQIEKGEKRVQESSLEALRAAAATVKAELVKEMEFLSQAAVDQAQKRIAEQTTAALDSLGKKLLSNLSKSAGAALERTVAEMSERFRNRLQALAGGFGEEASQQLKERTSGLMESAAELMEKQIADSLEMFSQDLLTTGQWVVGETAKQLENTKDAVQSLTRELTATLESRRKESQELGQTGARELKAALQKGLDAQRDAALGQLREEAKALLGEALGRVKAGCGEAHQACDAMHKQVGQAAMTLQEWQDRARKNVEARFQDSLEAVVENASHLSRQVVEQHRQEMVRLTDELRARIQQVAELLAGTHASGEKR
jgi:hypothetical protein